MVYYTLLQTGAKMRADQRQYHIIYKTTCLTTGKWYLGMHSTDDLNDGYLGSGQLLWKSLKKYGKDNHQYEILEYLPSRKALILREEELITDEVRNQPQCLNLRNGGTGNDPGFWEMTDEDKRTQASERLSVKSKKMWAERKADPIALAEHIAKAITPESIGKRAATTRARAHKRTPEQLANLTTGQQSYYANVDPTVLKTRGQKAAQTRLERGTNKGGRPKGIPATESQKQCKTWIIQTEDGAKQVIRNLKAFCEEHNISRTSFVRSASNDKFMNGFRLVGPT
jgi:hypothetical protein